MIIIKVYEFYIRPIYTTCNAVSKIRMNVYEHNTRAMRFIPRVTLCLKYEWVSITAAQFTQLVIPYLKFDWMNMSITSVQFTPRVTGYLKYEWVSITSVQFTQLVMLYLKFDWMYYIRAIYTLMYLSRAISISNTHPP